jgi:hypothetical protein
MLFFPVEDNSAAVDSLEAVLGVGAILMMVSITGFSAIYFERMLKKEGERITIWVGMVVLHTYTYCN